MQKVLGTGAFERRYHARNKTENDYVSFTATSR
ncbi:hypothetical protein SAMN04488004_12019 [Loktanella salsilacus]|uniref:Uncharacterized protein n=1 Tax=Loktanella salsilacus TaxID=195913 RepID=A0A1I4HVW8_9RHOB|nr:hypothetical protein SAMN04488004_12019 [Loktanella salsilacus]